MRGGGQGLLEDLELAWGLTWVASVGLGCPRPGLEGYWSLRSTASAGSPCSGQLPQVQERLPAFGLQGGVFRLPPGPRHKGQEACVAWLAWVPWPRTYNWGWRCRVWCRCRCHWSRPWRRGPALAPGGPEGRTSVHHCGCWRHCWRGYCCWNGLSTEVHPGRQGSCVTSTLGVGASAHTGTPKPGMSTSWLLPYWYSYPR